MITLGHISCNETLLIGLEGGVKRLYSERPRPVSICEFCVMDQSVVVGGYLSAGQRLERKCSEGALAGADRL